MLTLADLIDRADAILAAIVTAIGAFLVSRQSRETNLRASLDSSAMAVIDRLDQRVTSLEETMGQHDAYAAYAVAEMHRVEDWLEEQDMHWPPPPPMSFYAWLNEQDKR